MEISTFDYVLLATGLGLSVLILFSAYHFIHKTTHNGAVSTISVAAFMTALAAFCISTPKINGFVIKIGESVLKLSEINKKIDDKKEELAALEQSLEHAAMTAAEDGPTHRQASAVSAEAPLYADMLKDLVGKVKQSDSGFAYYGAWIGMDSRYVKNIANSDIPKIGENEYLFFQLAKKNPESLNQTGFVVKQGSLSERQKFNISNATERAVINSINKVVGKNPEPVIDDKRKKQPKSM